MMVIPKELMWVKSDFRPLAGMIGLGEEHFPGWSLRGSPIFDPPLQRSQLTVLVRARLHPLESFENSLSFQAGIIVQQFFDPGPVVPEGILAGPPEVLRLCLAG